MTTARQAADLLLQARSERRLTDAIAPQTEAEAYTIQALVMAELGDIGGWKVGAPGPAAAPNCAPLPARFVLASPAALTAEDFPAPFIESEIAFSLGADLPARAVPYTEAEVRDAIALCHPAIELVQSRFADPEAAGPLANLADLIRHGAFVWGEPIGDWQDRDFATMALTQSIESQAARRGVGNPAGDMMRLLLWLANVGARWAGGLRAGQIVTCGSWTGMTPVQARTSRIVTAFEGAEPVVLRLG